MKNCCFTNSILLMFVLFLLVNCTGQSEADANRLAKLQSKRIATIHQMLKSKDTVDMKDYRLQVMELDAEYELFKNYCDNKYTDSVEKIRFRNAYQKAMNSTTH
jgi:hypothetical protein